MNKKNIKRVLFTILLLIIFLVIFVSVQIKTGIELKLATVNVYSVCGALDRFYDQNGEYPENNNNELLASLIQNDQDNYTEDFLSATKIYLSDEDKEMVYLRDNEKKYTVSVIDYSFWLKETEVICKSYSFAEKGKSRMACRCSKK